MDLVNTGVALNNMGERQVTNSILRNERIIFTTLLPEDSTDACATGGSGWLMELDAFDGGRLSEPPFDLNEDAIFGVEDNIGVDQNTVVSGKKSKVGAIPTPTVITDVPGSGGPVIEYKITPGSTGAIEVTTENPGPAGNQRETWRQIK